MRGFYGLEVKFLRRKDDRAPFIVGRNIDDGFEKVKSFLLSVRGARFVGFPPISLHIFVTKPATKTSRWGAPFLWLDQWRQARFLRLFEVLLTLNMRVPRAGDNIRITGGAENADV